MPENPGMPTYRVCRKISIPQNIIQSFFKGRQFFLCNTSNSFYKPVFRKEAFVSNTTKVKFTLWATKPAEWPFALSRLRIA